MSAGKVDPWLPVGIEGIPDAMFPPETSPSLILGNGVYWKCK
jgi:hypothetical protein